MGKDGALVRRSRKRAWRVTLEQRGAAPVVTFVEAIESYTAVARVSRTVAAGTMAYAVSVVPAQRSLGCT